MVSNNSSFSKQKIKAVVLSAGRDFGRCPLASRLPAALWPVAGHSALESLLLHLAGQGIRNVVICSGSDKSLFSESIHIENRLGIEYLDEPLPVGTAGSIREAAKEKEDSLLIIFPSGLICPPDIDALISEHIKGESHLTVVLEPGYSINCEKQERASGIYICNPSVLEFIPKDGYFDIKEGLIPKMLREGNSVHAVTLSRQAGNFRDCHEYLRAVSYNIEKITELNNLKPCKINDSCALWTGTGVQIDPRAIIAGQVVLMDGVRVSEGAVITGPSVLGKNVTIGRDSIIVNSILWDNAIVNANCIINQCVLDYNTKLQSFTNAAERCLISRPKKLVESLNGSVLKIAQNKRKLLRKIPVKINQRFTKTTTANIQKMLKFIASALILTAFTWSYWPGLRDLWNVWMRSDEYSSGLLVPFLAFYIFWLRRKIITGIPLKPSIFGLFLFIFAQAMRIFGLLFLFVSAERLSIVLSIAGIVLLLSGWKLFIKVSTILLFLFLMLPWPNRIQSAVSLPLQSLSTSSAVFCLQVMGFDIIREGNVIHIGNSTVAVAEACNGLRMITAFFVISGLVALLIKRTWWEKLIVLISSLPIAFLCNTLRLTATAIFFTMVEGPYWEKVFHDFGGYAMMPLALAFIVGQLWLIDKLTVPPEEKKEIIIVRQNK